MDVSSVSQSSAIAQMAVRMKGENFQNEYSVAILKQQQDLQKMMGDALVGMINQSSPSAEVTVGANLDLQV
jgi:hypothetical protein